MSIKRKTLLCVAALTLLGLLGGCASKGTGSYVVLLRDPDGKLGQVAVKTPQGEQVLTQTFKGTSLDGSKEPFFVMQTQLKRDFGAAMAAMPPPIPPRFPLEFALGKSDEMAPGSIEALRDIAADAKRQNTVDITVVGHTDTRGKPQDNFELARKRAEFVAAQLRAALPSRVNIHVRSDGQTNPKIKTGDQVDEPANRRVEVILH